MMTIGKLRSLNMRAFDCVYEGKRYPVMASTHLAARSLGTRHIANVLGAVEPSKVAVVDLEIAAGYKPTRYLDVTKELSGNELAFIETHERLHANMWQARSAEPLCVCVAGLKGIEHCTCKSVERREWHRTAAQNRACFDE